MPRGARSGSLRAGPAVGALLALAVASGCGADAEEGPAQAADGFAAAVTDGDGRTACAILTDAAADELETSTGQPCDQAVLDEVQPPGERLEVRRFGTMAQIRFRDDMLFLAQAPDSWRVLAAGCRPMADDQPYDCAVSGG